MNKLRFVALTFWACTVVHTHLFVCRSLIFSLFLTAFGWTLGWRKKEFRATMLICITISRNFEYVLVLFCTIGFISVAHSVFLPASQKSSHHRLPLFSCSCINFYIYYWYHPVCWRKWENLVNFSCKWILSFVKFIRAESPEDESSQLFIAKIERIVRKFQCKPRARREWASRWQLFDIRIMQCKMLCVCVCLNNKIAMRNT